MHVLAVYSHVLSDSFSGALLDCFVDDPEHADQAVRCAIAMQARLVELNARWSDQGRPEFHSGVGINSGEVVVGNLGSDQMQSYTVIGDHLNLERALRFSDRIDGHLVSGHLDGVGIISSRKTVSRQ